jgi:putative hydrolase of HD superfamily
MDNISNTEKLLGFFDCAERLKTTMRYKSNKEILHESSAAHSWKLSLMVLATCRELGLELDLERAMKLAIVHDLAEAITDDIDYFLIADGKVSKDQKRKLEAEAMTDIRNMLAADVGQELYELWDEYDNGASDEAKFVKALDRIEALTHLLSIGSEAYDRPELIVNYADSAVADFPALKPMLKTIKDRFKQEFKKGGIAWKQEYE